MQKRFLYSFYNTHKNNAIWIAGSDPSLTNYPDGFFDDKIGITLHLAHLKFPKATYRYSSEYDRSEYLRKIDPNYSKDILFAGYPFYGTSCKKTVRLFSEGEGDNVYYHHHFSYPPNGVRDEVDMKWTKWKVRQAMSGKARYWGSHGTCLHSAFFIAIFLGASEINIIGCSHGLYKSQYEHFEQVNGTDQEMRPDGPSYSNITYALPTIKQTYYLIKSCKELGINVNWYENYSNEKMKTINIDDNWIKEQEEIVKNQQSKPSLVRIIGRKLIKYPFYRIKSQL
jgi:hypothetical protein